MSDARPAPQPGDPTMEDILASIRRILNEDDGAGSAGKAAAEGEPFLLTEAMMVGAEPPPEPEHPDAATAEAGAEAATLAEDAIAPGTSMPHSFSSTADPFDVLEDAAASPPAPPDAAPPAPPAALPVSAPRLPEPHPAMDSTPPSAPDTLLDDAAVAATAASLGSLLRAVSQDRAAPVRNGGGPSIEDVVRGEIQPLLRAWLGEHAAPIAERLAREELRPLLKDWLEINLAPIVERTVRTEIERVVGASLPRG